MVIGRSSMCRSDMVVVFAWKWSTNRNWKFRKSWLLPWINMCNYVELGQTCGAGLSSTFLMMRKFRRRVDGHVFLVVVTLAGRVSRCVRRSCRLSTNNAANHRDGDNHRPAPHLVVVTYLDLVKEDEPASQPSIQAAQHVCRSIALCFLIWTATVICCCWCCCCRCWRSPQWATAWRQPDSNRMTRTFGFNAFHIR